MYFYCMTTEICPTIDCLLGEGLNGNLRTNTMVLALEHDVLDLETLSMHYISIPIKVMPGIVCIQIEVE